jgi:hypothetical protein
MNNNNVVFNLIRENLRSSTLNFYKKNSQFNNSKAELHSLTLMVKITLKKYQYSIIMNNSMAPNLKN